MVGGFFSLLIGYFVFLIMTYREGNKVWKQEANNRNKNKQYAIEHNRPVWFYGYYKDKQIYIETKSGREVFEGMDKYGLKRWCYTNTNRPMQYPEDKRIIESLNRNKSIALKEKRKWCIAENFWDDSIIDIKGKTIISDVYLDDYGIDNNLNQRIYLKNMRPYQLYLLGTSGTEFDYFPLIKKQYLIRFGNLQFFNYKTQHCISDKQLHSNYYWSKWYAITEEEYLELTQPIQKEYYNKFNTSNCLKSLKSINMEDIAYGKGINKIDWELDNCGIVKAFDNNGNFIGN